MDIQWLKFSRFSKSFLVNNGDSKKREQGAITIVESLIAIAIGITILVVWAQQQSHKLQSDTARQTGRSIAAFSRAASVALAENPPTAATTLSIADLQDCTDPTGARFLACNYRADTVLPYILNDDGDAVTFDDLEIDVQIQPQGPQATIDFGVFRSGRDRDGNGLPDARPDLAALALNEAQTETSAGVLGFFEVVFAREDPTGIEFDPDSATYDSSAIDDLARIQTRIGVNSGDAPFLRLDGGNEMTGGITFENAMSIRQLNDGLAISGSGGLTISDGILEADSGITTSDITTEEITATESLTLPSTEGAVGEGFARLDQSADVSRIDGEVTQNRNNLITLIGRVDAHDTSINAIQSDVSANKNRFSLYCDTDCVNDIYSAMPDEAPDEWIPQTCSPSRATALARRNSDTQYRWNSDNCNQSRFSVNTPCSTTTGCIKSGQYCTWGSRGGGYAYVSSVRVSGGSKNFAYSTRNTQTLQCQNAYVKGYKKCLVRTRWTQCVNPK